MFTTPRAGSPHTLWFLATAALMIRKWRVTETHQKVVSISYQKKSMINGTDLWRLTILPGKAMKNSGSASLRAKYPPTRELAEEWEFMAPGPMTTTLLTVTRTGRWAAFR